jgi:DNA-binding response OmpR family regulator
LRQGDGIVRNVVGAELWGVRRRNIVTHEVPHILLTGDDIPFLLVMEELLRRHGYVCDCAHDVRAAAAALEAWPYDLLIADLDLPGNRELELVPASQGDGYSTPVIVLTGYPSVSTAVRSLYLAVVVEYLIKPVDPMELLRCVGPAVSTGQFWRATFQVYDKLMVRVGDVESPERYAVSNQLAPAEARLAGTLDTSLEHRRRRLEPSTEYREETLDARPRGVTGQVADGCALGNCAQFVAYADSLRETIAVLKKIKNASASKDLVALRAKLEALLKDVRGA